MGSTNILVITQSDSFAGVIEEVAAAIEGLAFSWRRSMEELVQCPRGSEPNLVILHVTDHQAGPDIERLQDRLSTHQPPVPLIVVSDHYDAEMALAALRRGVADYLTRPLDLGRLGSILDMLTLRARVNGRRPGSKPTVIRDPDDQRVFLYRAATPMGRLMDQIRRVAPLDSTLLLDGETGTGKTRLARIIHDLSPRRAEPFLVINCGALSPTLIESEMFGHVRGAYTGADADRVGKFAEVGRGTLLLDDIDALPPAIQAKLLRVVESRAFEPVGSNRTRTMQARLIAASHRPLPVEVAEGRFRPDLYYRLSVLEFRLPALRERPEEIGEIIGDILIDLARRDHRPVPMLSPEASAALERYPWPGNIRELRNVMERAFVLSQGGTIGLDEFPSAIRDASPSTDWVPEIAPEDDRVPSLSLAKMRSDAELSCIVAALAKHGNNRLRAAAELGISRMTLYKKLHKYGMVS